MPNTASFNDPQARDTKYHPLNYRSVLEPSKPREASSSMLNAPYFTTTISNTWYHGWGSVSYCTTSSGGRRILCCLSSGWVYRVRAYNVTSHCETASACSMATDHSLALPRWPLTSLMDVSCICDSYTYYTWISCALNFQLYRWGR